MIAALFLLFFIAQVLLLAGLRKSSMVVALVDVGFALAILIHHMTNTMNINL